jgi:hypothetical protein
VLEFQLCCSNSSCLAAASPHYVGDDEVTTWPLVAYHSVLKPTLWTVACLKNRSYIRDYSPMEPNSDIRMYNNQFLINSIPLCNYISNSMLVTNRHLCELLIGVARTRFLNEGHEPGLRLRLGS